MTEQSNIQSIHGRYFTAEICFKDVVGRISVNEIGFAYLCHNDADIGLKSPGCSDMLEYEYAWPAWGFGEKLQDSIQNLKILPSPLEYHQLLTEAMSDCEKSGDIEAVVAKIAGFLAGIKGFQPKNIGNNKNQSK